MRHTLLALGLAPFVLSIALPVLAAEGPAAKVSDLAWMSGSWEGPLAAGTLEENWSQPRAGSMAALVRATNGDATSMIELIVIEEEGGSLVLRVQQWNPGFVPRSEAPTVMRLVESSANKVVFEATSEGGLRRLGYSRPADDQFVIAIQTAQGAEFEIKLKAK